MGVIPPLRCRGGSRTAPTAAYRHPHPNLPPPKGKELLPPLILSLSKDAGTTAEGKGEFEVPAQAGTTVEILGCGGFWLFSPTPSFR